MTPDTAPLNDFEAPDLSPDVSPDVSVCVATFRRPQRLLRLLESLFVLRHSEGLVVEIVVADNDRAQSARSTVEGLQARSPYPLRYAVEPEQNISCARNRTVELARGTWIAFIDDDEVADTNWLNAYWLLQGRHPGDGYFGTVFPRLERDAPAWLDKDMFFGRRRIPTGTRMRPLGTYTTNAFIRRTLFATERFDPRFVYPGFEDVEVFTRMIDGGAEFYYCDEAVTYEYYPPERLRFGWLVKRHFRGGFMSTRLDKLRRPGLARQMPSFFKASGGACLFALMLPVELLRGWKYAAKRFLRLTLQVGHLWEFSYLARFFGNLTFGEYRVRGQH